MFPIVCYLDLKWAVRGHHLVPASSSIIQSSRIHISSHLRNPENNFYCAIFSHGMGLAVFLYRSSLEVISAGSVTRNKNLTVQCKPNFPSFLTKIRHFQLCWLLILELLEKYTGFGRPVPWLVSSESRAKILSSYWPTEWILLTIFEIRTVQTLPRWHAARICY